MSTDSKRKPIRENGPSRAGWIVLASLSLVLCDAGCSGISPLDRMRHTKAVAQLESIAMAVDLYTLDCGWIPTAEQGLAALSDRPRMDPVPMGWRGPYLDAKSLVDPWGRPFEYLVPGGGGFPFGIRCLGADGREGGDGQDRDVVSWDDGGAAGAVP
jgi:general secretion pathway protein G